MSTAWAILEAFEAGLVAAAVDRSSNTDGMTVVYGGPDALLSIDLDRRFIFAINEGPAPTKGRAGCAYEYIQGEVIARYSLEPTSRRVWLEDARVLGDRMLALRNVIPGMHSIDVTPLAPDYTIYRSANAVGARWLVKLTYHVGAS